MTKKQHEKLVRKKIRKYAKINILSPGQKDELLKLDFDTDFLEDKIAEALASPDIEYLKKVLLPKKRRKKNRDINSSLIMAGVFAGDVIGSEYEFSEHDYLSISENSLTSVRSRFTDDSILALATQKAIRETRNEPDFRKAYIEAYIQYPDAGYGSAFIRWAKGEEISNEKGYGSYGNGSAMRVAAIGAEYEPVEDVVDQAIRSACVTHNHQHGIIGAVVTAVVVWMAKRGYSKMDIKKYASRYYHWSDTEKAFLVNKEVYFDIDTRLKQVPNIVSRNSLFCSYAVPFAIKCFLETESFAGCMAEVLRHFGDTDTICAIAGGICAAYYGETFLSSPDTARIVDISQKIAVF